MSYILKALRKSEAERARGTVPGLATQHAVAVKGRGPLWPWVVAGALVVNAAVVVSGVWRPEIPLWRTGGPAEVDGTTVARPAPPAQAMPDPTRAAAPPATAPQVLETENTAGPEQAAVPTPVAAARAAKPSPAGSPIMPRDSRQEAAQVETRLPVATVASDVAAPPAPGSVRPGPSPQTRDAPKGPATPDAAAAPRPATKPAAILALADRTPDPELPISLDTGPAAAAGPDLALTVAEPPAAEAPPEPDPYASVPMLWQLPSSIRSKLPEISLTVHVYAPESSGRFVIVNRRKYREGDALGVGVKLEAIVPDGVILDYDGRIFKKSN
ncbi:MAG: general secretion pathway protein GspB [Rhodospirillales bacterium]|nr:general secretion pathway protein GspB [Rhodospirillales bacterium]MDH3913532.1 general secretion pathway protein GspB [Rhodospirillales bacterium]MDH3969972.1 general secretion pathway protein GspB [Rhodospirillales bacterium]